MCRCSVMLKNFSGSSHNGVGERTGNPSELDTVKSIPLATLAEKALTFSYSLKKRKKIKTRKPTHNSLCIALTILLARD